MTNNVSITRKHGDTQRIVFVLSGKTGPIRVGSWSNFWLTVDSSLSPLSLDTARERVQGTVETNGINGRVYFVPLGTLPLGNYYYTAKAKDENNELVTFAQGTYVVQ